MDHRSKFKECKKRNEQQLLDIRKLGIIPMYCILESSALSVLNLYMRFRITNFPSQTANPTQKESAIRFETEIKPV
jgi:hypothetical protein